MTWLPELFRFLKVIRLLQFRHIKQMKISKFRKWDIARLKIDFRFWNLKLYLQLVLKRKRLIETLHQKYGLYTLPDGG